MTRAQGKHGEFSLNQSVATLFLNVRQGKQRGQRICLTAKWSHHG